MKLKPFSLAVALVLATAAAALSAQTAGAPPLPASGQPKPGSAAATVGAETSNSPAAPAADDSAGPYRNAPLGENQGGFPISDPDIPKPGPLPEKNVEDPSDTSDLIPPSTLPEDKATLVGGFVKEIDPVNDRLTVVPFGAKQKMKVFFDDRSKVYRNGREVSPIAIRKGDRIYLDTQLDKKQGRVFARNVRVQTKPLQADAHGQIVSYDPAKNLVAVHDDLSGQDVQFHVQPTAIVDNQGHPGSLADLQPGALVTARFLAGQDVLPGRNEVNKVTIIAAPGSDYTFEGRLTHLDVRNHVMGIENQSDGKIYDVHYDPAVTPIGALQVGSSVNVSARFDGAAYNADSLTESEGLSLEEQDQAAKDDGKSDQGKKSKKSKKHDQTKANSEKEN